MALRVLHLAGSAVNDFYADLSLAYAQDCLRATADPARYETHVAYISPDRQWRFPTDLSRAAIAAALPMPVGDALTRILAFGIDVVVPQMFCLPGMTHYRALFDVLGIPYVGNTPATMALAANKMRAKAVVSAAGVGVPRAELLHRGDRPTLLPPAVVKPVDADNSLGLTLVRQQDRYPTALADAFAHSGSVLVESYVELGREVRCGILEEDGALMCLPLEEYNVSRDHRPVRKHDDKISRRDDGAVHLVAKDSAKAWIVDLADPVTERVWAVARQCHTALGCRDYSLFDFRIDPDGDPWFLEAGLYCSFANKSVITVMAAAAGRPIDQLFDQAIRQAVTRQAAVSR